MADNSGVGLKGPFVWTGQGVEGQISPIHDTPSVATLTHTQHAHIIRTSGALSQRLWLRQIWESSTSGALTFHCEVKGGVLCGGKGEGERQKEDFHCFDQIAGGKKLQLLRFLYLRQSYVAKCKIRFKKTKKIFCR